MSRTRALIVAGIAGLLAIAGAGAAAAAAPPAAAPHWHIVESVKTTAFDFTAVVATGKTTGWAFGGNNPDAAPTAWQRNGAAWTKVAFPGVKDDNVVYAAATSPANVWAFANNPFGTASQVLHWAGAKWSAVKTFKGAIGGATVLGASDVWVYGETIPTGLGVWHYNGHVWTEVGKNFDGGSALSDTSVWAFLGTNVEHWNGHTWTATSVKKLLPPVIPGPLNFPAVTGILAVSATNVWAVGNGDAQDEGGPMVVLHYNGTVWSRVAEGGVGYGTGQQISLDGSGGLWIPEPGAEGAASFMLHFTGGKLVKITLPQKTDAVTVARIPGTSEQLAGGYVPNPKVTGAPTAAVILQYS